MLCRPASPFFMFCFLNMPAFIRSSCSLGAGLRSSIMPTPSNVRVLGASSLPGVVSKRCQHGPNADPTRFPICYWHAFRRWGQWMCQIGLASLGQSEMGCVCRCRRDELNELMCENAWRPFPVVAIGRACFACRFSEVASFGAFRKSASDAHFLPLDDVSCEKRSASCLRKTA